MRLTILETSTFRFLHNLQSFLGRYLLLADYKLPPVAFFAIFRYFGLTWCGNLNSAASKSFFEERMQGLPLLGDCFTIWSPSFNNVMFMSKAKSFLDAMGLVCLLWFCISVFAYLQNRASYCCIFCGGIFNFHGTCCLAAPTDSGHAQLGIIFSFLNSVVNIFCCF